MSKAAEHLVLLNVGDHLYAEDVYFLFDSFWWPKSETHTNLALLSVVEEFLDGVLIDV